MSKEKSILIVFSMKNDIQNVPQDIGLMDYVNQNVVTMVKHIFETQKQEKLLWAEAMATKKLLFLYLTFILLAV